MAKRINVRPDRQILFDNQADARVSAFEQQADRADCEGARLIVELLRKIDVVKLRKMHCALGIVKSSDRP
jgi:hypothetical protein